MKFSIDTEKPTGWHDTYCSGCKSTPKKLSHCAAEDCYMSFCTSCRAKCCKEIHGLTICKHCFSGTKPIGDKFEENEKHDDPMKKFFRMKFVNQVAREAKRSESSNILMLDCGETTDEFMKMDVDGVWVPNPSPEITEKLRGMGAHAYQQRVGHFLTQKYCTYDYVWLDYCGSYDGSNVTGAYPRQDLRKLWEYALGKKNEKVYVAVTFCKRGGSTSMEQMIQEQVETAETHGWEAKAIDKKHYGKSMYYVMFKASLV
jgi:hypothetical protein